MNFYKKNLKKKIISLVTLLGILAMVAAPVMPALAANEITFSLKVANVSKGDTTWAKSNVATPGDTLKYLLTIKNNTATDLTNTILRISLPAGISYQAGSTYVYSTASKDLQPDGIISSGLNMHNLFASTTQYMTITAKADLGSSGPLSASATVSADSVAQTSDSATVNVTAINPPSNLSASVKAADLTRGDTIWASTSITAHQGDSVKLLFTILNSGANTSKNTIMRLALPAGISYQAGSTYVYSNTGKDLQPDGIASSGINMQDLAPNLTQYMTVTLRVDPAAANADYTPVLYIKADNNAEITSSMKIVVGSAGSIQIVSGNINVTVGPGNSTTLTIAIKDSSGQPLPGQPVNFSILSGNGTISPASATTDVNGQVSFTYTPDNISGPAVIKIQANGFSDTITITKLAATPSAANSTITVSPAAASVGATINVTVTLRDQYNNLVPSKSVVLTSSRGATDTIAPASASTGTATNNPGVASFTITSNMAGAATLSARDTTDGINLTATASVTFNSAGANQLVKSSGDNQTGIVGQALVSPLVTRVQDNHGNPVSGVVMSYSVTSGAGNLSATNGTTNAAGEVSTTLTLGQAPGQNRVTAHVDGLTDVIFAATANTGAPANLSYVSGGGQSAAVGTTLVAPLIAKLTDQYNNPIAGLSINFSVTSRPAGDVAASVSAASATTNAAGQAQVSLNLGTKPGAYIVQATYAGVTGSPVSFNETATVASIASLVKISGDTQQSSVNTALPNPLVVEARDQFDNPIPNVSMTFAFASVPGGTAGNSFAPAATSNTNSLGQAQVTVNLGNKGGAYTISATAAGAPAVTFSATANALDHYNLVVTVGDHFAGQGFQAIITARTITNDILTSDASTVDLTMTGSIKAYSDVACTAQITTATLGGGTVTVYLKDTVAETVVVTATKQASVETGNTGNLIILPSPNLVITKVSGDNQIGDSNAALTNNFVVSVLDIYGNLPTLGTPMTFAVTNFPLGATGYSVSASPVGTDALGNASSKLTLGNIAGIYQVSVTTPGAAAVTFNGLAQASLSMAIISGTTLNYGGISPNWADDAKTTQIRVKANSSNYSILGRLSQPLTKVTNPADTFMGNPQSGKGFGFSTDDGANWFGFTTSDQSVISPAINNAFNVYACPTPAGGTVYTIKYKLATDWTISDGSYTANVIYTIAPTF